MRYLFIKERETLFKQCGKCARQYRRAETIEKKESEKKRTWRPREPGRFREAHSHTSGSDVAIQL